MIGLIEKTSLAAMAAGLALILQPWWAGGFRAGFFVVAFATLAYIVFSHLRRREDA